MQHNYFLSNRGGRPTIENCRAYDIESRPRLFVPGPGLDMPPSFVRWCPEITDTSMSEKSIDVFVAEIANLISTSGGDYAELVVRVDATKMTRPSFSIETMRRGNEFISGRQLWTVVSFTATINPFFLCGKHATLVIIFGNEVWRFSDVTVAPMAITSDMIKSERPTTDFVACFRGCQRDENLPTPPAVGVWKGPIDKHPPPFGIDVVVAAMIPARLRRSENDPLWEYSVRNITSVSTEPKNEFWMELIPPQV